MTFKTTLTALAITATTMGVAQASTTHCGMFSCPSGAPSNNDVVERAIYKISSNRTTKFADWAAYKVTPQTIDGPSRSRSWKSDPAISGSYTLEPSDYTDAWAVIGTDRGHQVPLASFSNTAYWRDTNYLSNITPQDSNLNQGPWVRLEPAVRAYVRTGKDDYVVTGPLYEQYFATLPGANEGHTVPSGYYKAVFTISSSGWVEASAFIMNQSATRSSNYCGYEVPINEVESRSGLNIMPSLPSYKEWSVEGVTGGLRAELGC